MHNLRSSTRAADDVPSICAYLSLRIARLEYIEVLGVNEDCVSAGQRTPLGIIEERNMNREIACAHVNSVEIRLVERAVGCETVFKVWIGLGVFRRNKKERNRKREKQDAE